jgi:hypothetical protein
MGSSASAMRTEPQIGLKTHNQDQLITLANLSTMNATPNRVIKRSRVVVPFFIMIVLVGIARLIT